MVKLSRSRAARRHGVTLLELMVAVGILTFVLAGFAAVSSQEWRLARESYFRAAAMEIVDGEMEALAAGEWKAYGKGRHAYVPRAESAANLPLGGFVLTVDDATIRLEWVPEPGAPGSRVVREASVR